MTISLVIVSLIAFLTPMILARFKISIIPTSVAEIIIGVIIGKSFLGIVQTNDILSNLSDWGVLLLMFLSGMEIDFNLFKRNVALTPLEEKRNTQQGKTVSPVKVASIAYIISIAVSFILALLFQISGLFNNVILATILFSTVSLGIVTALLKENELLSKKFGQSILLFAVLGEVIPMLALTIYSSIYSGHGGSLWLIGILFVVAAWLLRRFRQFFTFFDKINKSTTQLDMRLALLLISILVVLATYVGAEDILGAFIAGMVMKLLQPNETTQIRIDAVGYGFLIPFFFIMTGVNLNIPALLKSPQTLILIPLFFISFIIAKLPTYFGYRLAFDKRNSLSGAIVSSTTITLVLASLKVAQEIGAVNSQQAGAFTLAGIITCIFGPMLFNNLYQIHPEDIHKNEIHIIGTNIITVTVAQQISKEWFNIVLYTTSKQDYETFKSKANVVFLNSNDIQSLINEGVFDADMIVISHSDDDINFRIALAAKEYGIPDVLTRLNTIDPTNTMTEELKEHGIHTLTSFSAFVDRIRTSIEYPSLINIISAHDDSRIYEIRVTNSLYDGLEIRKLPHVQDVTISRIYRNGELISPHGDTVIRVDDHIILTGNHDVVNELHDTLGAMNE